MYREIGAKIIINNRVVVSFKIYQINLFQIVKLYWSILNNFLIINAFFPFIRYLLHFSNVDFFNFYKSYNIHSPKKYL